MKHEIVELRCACGMTFYTRREVTDHMNLHCRKFAGPIPEGNFVGDREEIEKDGSNRTN